MTELGRTIRGSAETGPEMQLAQNDVEVLDRLLRERHSCRAFEPDPVPRGTIERLLTVAQRAVSDCNIQPWQVTILSGAATNRVRTAMYERASSNAGWVSDLPPTEYVEPYLQRRRDCGWALYNAVGVVRGDREGSSQQSLENYRFFGAPHLAIISIHQALGVRSIFDAGAYLMSFLLAAQALGVAAIPQTAIGLRVDVLRELLTLPGDHLIISGISFGFEKAGHPANGFRTVRASISESVSFVDE